MKHGDDEEFSNGRERVDERDRSVSDLIVRVNEPDLYTPTLDLSAKTKPGVSFDPGVRRVLRTNADESLELALAEQEAAVGELKQAVAKYEQEQSSLLSWVWAGLAVLLAVALVVWLGDKK